MKRTPQRYLVTVLDDDGTEAEHTITVTHQDRLRAEQMAHQLGVPGLADAQMTGITMWCWAALRRLKLTEAKAKRFLDHDCVDIEKVPDDDDQDRDVDDDDESGTTPELEGHQVADPTPPGQHTA